MPTKKKLYRSRTDRVLFGVCGGLAKYYKIDPVIVRIAFIIAGLVNGLGILVYAIMFVLVPLESGEYVQVDRMAKVKDMAKKVEAKAGQVVEEVKKEAKSVKDEFKK